MSTRNPMFAGAAVVATLAFGVSCGSGMEEAPLAPTSPTAAASTAASAAEPAHAPNSPPELNVSTKPPIGADGKIAAGNPPAPVKINLCRSRDSDEGDRLVRFKVDWADGAVTGQGAPGAGLSPEDNPSDTGCDSEGCCRHYHTYLDRGIFFVTASLSDGHLEDESRSVSSLALVSTTIKIDTEHSTSNVATLTSPEQTMWATVMGWAGISAGA